jgi:hypothetical protein
VADHLYLKNRNRVTNIAQLEMIIGIIESRTDYRFAESKREDSGTSAS